MKLRRLLAQSREPLDNFRNSLTSVTYNGSMKCFNLSLTFSQYSYSAFWVSAFSASIHTQTGGQHQWMVSKQHYYGWAVSH